jgi:hypothetical protein
MCVGFRDNYGMPIPEQKKKLKGKNRRERREGADNNAQSCHERRTDFMSSSYANCRTLSRPRQRAATETPIEASA